MDKLKKILQIEDVREKYRNLKNYAHEAGLSSPEIADSLSELIDKLSKFQRHRTNVILTVSSILVAGGWLAWAIYSSTVLFPPKYTLDGTTLHFGQWFGRAVEQKRKKNPEINIYNRSAEFELHFILLNRNRGEGEVSKPILMVTAENSEKEFQMTPKTRYSETTRTEGNMTSYHTIDSGRTIKVGSYGIVDDFLKYSIRDSSKGQKELMEFLKENEDKLKFKIKGEPYGEVEIKFVADYRR